MFRVFHILCQTFPVFFFWRVSSILYISHGFLVFVPSLSEMAELRANGFGVPILFSIDANGFARVFSFHLSIRFSLHDGSIWVEREIYDPLISMLSLTMRKNSILTNNGSSVWELAAG